MIAALATGSAAGTSNRLGDNPYRRMTTTAITSITKDHLNREIRISCAEIEFGIQKAGNHQTNSGPAVRRNYSEITSYF